MPENLFESMTAADFMAFMADIPADKKPGAAFFMLGWFQADLTDQMRGRAASELLTHTGATVIPFRSTGPADGFSPLEP